MNSRSVWRPLRKRQPVDASGCLQLADLLDHNRDALMETWERVGDAGPTFGSPSAGTPAEARELFLRPLAGVFTQGLRGSRDHAAVYLDERLRYIDDKVGVEHRKELLRSNLAVEFAEIAHLVTGQMEHSQVQSLLWEFHAPLLEESTPAEKILFVGDCLFVETRAFLIPLCREAGLPIDVRHIFFSAHQARENVNTSIIEEVSCYQPDIIAVSLFTFEGDPLYRLAWRQAAKPMASHAISPAAAMLLETVHTIVMDIRTVSKAPILIHSPAGVPLDPVRRRLTLLPAHSAGQRSLLTTIGRGIDELIAATENTLQVSESGVVAASGMSVRVVGGPVFDKRQVPSGYFHTTRLGPMIAHEYQQVVVDFDLLRNAKVLLVDFDNTLWDGVMAEGPVRHNREGQQLLIQLRNAGVVLVALSKNDPATIKWDEMSLSEDDFALLKINWSPKPDNVSESIHELNLAPDAFVLLDDNPAERALVTEQVPGVRAIDPTEMSTWVALRRWLNFPSTSQTEEAKSRTEMYREAAERNSAMRGKHDFAEMMSSLRLEYSVRVASESDLDRVVELVQRTNQFNTTTLRRSRGEIQGLIADPDCGVYVATLKDRFGDLGVVAVAIFQRREHTFESVIMSCRAMGFGLELAMISDVVANEATGPVRGIFLASARNAPAAQLFAECGFASTSAEEWLLPNNSSPTPAPTWLQRTVGDEQGHRFHSRTNFNMQRKAGKS